MRYFIKTILLGALVVLGTTSLLAQDGLDLSVKGFVDTYHAMRIEAPNDWMSSRTRVRGECRLEKEGGGAFVSANLIYNALLSDQTGFQLREAYLYWGNSDWDIRASARFLQDTHRPGESLVDGAAPARGKARKDHREHGIWRSLQLFSRWHRLLTDDVAHLE